MDKVEFLGVRINMFGERDIDVDYDFGGVTLECEGREYILDVVQTFWEEENGDANVYCELAVDKDTFEDCKYNLTSVDLLGNNLKATMFFDGTFPNIIESMTLFVKSGGMTKAIDLEQD